MKKIILFSFILMNFMFAQEKPSNSPVFFGYVRAWYQSDLSTNQGSFLVKMARLGAKGTVNEYAGYKLFVDFTRLGALQTKTAVVNGVTVVTSASASFSNYLLDADAYIKPFKNLTIDLGQFKVPFSTDNLRSGSDIDFVNRPLITSVNPGLRDIGFMASYSIKGSIPAQIHAGVFNGSGQNKSENDKTQNYSLRGVIQPVKGLNFSANYYSGKLSGADISIYNFGFDYKFGNAFFDGEYAGRNTDLNGASTISNAFFFYAYYDFDFGKSEIAHIVPAVRYERYDPSTSVQNNEIGKTTLGISLDFAKIRFAQFRINYEKYDYKNGAKNPDKLIIELQTKF